MDENRRGVLVRALRFLQHPTERLHVITGMPGTILHEVAEDEWNRHKLFIQWENGGKFYAFEEEIAIDAHIYPPVLN